MLSFKLRIFLSSFLISFFAFSQTSNDEIAILNLADSLRKSSNFTAAISQYDLLLKSSSSDSIAFKANYGKGYALFSLNNIPSAIESIELSIKSAQSFQDPYSIVMIEPYALLGYLYRYFDRNERLALKYYQLELATISVNDSIVPANRKFYNSYNLATTYRIIEDYELGINYAFNALRIARGENNKQLIELAYSAIANIYNATKQYAEAIEYYQKKIDITTELYGQNVESLSTDYNNLGLAQMSLNYYSKALKSYNTSLSISKSKEMDQAYTLMLIGDLYRQKGAIGNAKYNLKKSLSLTEDIDTKSIGYRFLGQVYTDEHQYDSAEFYFEKSILTKIGVNGKHITELKVDQITEIPSLFQTLNLAAQSFLDQYKTTLDLAALKKANLVFQKLDSVALTRRNLFATEEAKLFFQDNAHNLYENALEANYLLQNESSQSFNSSSDLVWHFMEVNRNLTLQELINQAKYYDNLGIPDSLQSLEQMLYQQEVSIKSKILSCELDENCSEQKLTELRENWLKNEQEYGNLLNRFEANYPDYYKIKYSTGLISQDSFQNQMNEELLVSFFQGERFIYWLAMDKASKKIGRIAFDDTLKKHIINFITETSGQTLNKKPLKKAYEDYGEAAYTLYESLLKPIIELNPDHDGLVIMTDGILSEISFEALIRTPVDNKTLDFKKLDYLINTFQVDYSLSANLLHQSKMTTSLKLTKAIAFGNPTYSGLSTLYGSQEELESIKSILGSVEVYSGNMATKKNFNKAIKAKDFELLHLALHGYPNQENALNSKLVFSNSHQSSESSELYLYELYSLDLPAKLVVLSACETSLGQWSKGEGIMNLARGFVYNGNPNIVTSLWKLNDRKSAKIMDFFYRNLFQEKPIGESLREAKLKLIQSSDELTSHPANWAAMIHIGSSDLKISPKQKSNIWDRPVVLSILALLVLTAILWTVKKRLYQMKKPHH